MTRFEPSLHSSGRMGVRLAVVSPDGKTPDHGCNRGQHEDTDLYRIPHTTSVPSPATPWEERRPLIDRCGRPRCHVCGTRERQGTVTGGDFLTLCSETCPSAGQARRAEHERERTSHPPVSDGSGPHRRRTAGLGALLAGQYRCSV